MSSKYLNCFEKFIYFATSNTWKCSYSTLSVNAMNNESLYLLPKIPYQIAICANKVEGLGSFPLGYHDHNYSQ